METVRTVSSLRDTVRAWRARNESVALVPTMGALHEGHLTLVRTAGAEADRTCVTLFVNPTQFGPDEDFDSYPRDPERDAEKLSDAGADLLFMPEVDEMYAEGHATRVRVDGLGDVLEGAFRPGFFEGVATVVTKLLLQSLPDVALFGEKDYQQLLVIRRLTRDLDIPVRIGAVPIVREPDGLALSSRNAYLTPEERRVAPRLHATLRSVADAVRRGADPAAEETRGRGELERAGFGEVDYVAVRDAATLEGFEPGRPGRVLAAAWLGRARLIDNVAVPA